VKALSHTIKLAWSTFNSACFQNVYKRWQQVLQLVIDDQGGNGKVDERSKELLAPVVMPNEYDHAQEESDEDSDVEQGENHQEDD
jgi:hypothetical protein